jgi:phage protein D
MEDARRTQVQVWIEGQDVTEEISEFLEAVSFADKLSSEADTIGLTLDNSDGRFSDSWCPAYGSSITAKLTTNAPWIGTQTETHLGDFAVDKMTDSWPPAQVQIGGISAPLTTKLRRFKRSRSWERVTLQKIAQDIADDSELPLFFDAEEGGKYTRKDQKNESDLNFLLKLCKDQALDLKVTNGMIAIFDRTRYEEKDPVATLDLTRPEDHPFVLKGSIEAVKAEQYSKVVVKYYDFQAGKLLKGEAEDPMYNDGPTLTRHARVDSVAEAQKMARALLWTARIDSTPLDLTVLGSPALMSGVCLAIQGKGHYDGKYMITKAIHDCLGWTTKLRLEKVIDWTWR